ncbi:MAG: porphobilinogen synthase, partial [Deltaproteobacteria bacterium]|nr:porphobilinogen synthase [Deltaproteobacteria bacterium]
MKNSIAACGSFPATRLRRNRQATWTRNLVREHQFTPHDIIWPLFVHDQKENAAIGSMPGVFRHSLKDLVVQAKRAESLGIPAVALFPAIDPSLKNAQGSEATNPDNLVCRSIRAVKEAAPGVGIICDVALDPFTSHGHDGLLREEDGVILNDETVKILCEQAIVQARSGCDVIAPSDMMDGRVGAVRQALDQEGFTHVAILSYAAKYASAFYGPFRDAIGSNTLTGKDKARGFRDKSGYQMDPANTDEALREVALDIQEGADMVMVKPGLPYLDVLCRVKETFAVPTYAYQVSGEYSMLSAAFAAGYLDRKRSIL